MKMKYSVKMTIAGLIGCGVCCLPLLMPLILPVATGFLSVSVIGFSLGSILCGTIFFFLAIALYGMYLTKRKTQRGGVHSNQ